MREVRFAKLRQLFRPPPPTELCVYLNDLPTRLINNLNLSSFKVFLFYLVLFLGIKLLINAVNSTLISDTLYNDFASDLTIFPPFAFFYRVIEAIGRLFGSGNSQGIHFQSLSGSNNVAIPYLRDYGDIILMVIASLHMTLVHRQWLRISGAFSKLWTDKVLNPDVFKEKEYKDIINDTNIWFRQKRWNYLVIAFSAATILVIFLSFAHYGIYSGLSRTIESAHSTWGELAYSGWWSNPITNGWVPLLYNVGVYFVFLYYILLHNVIGFGTVRMFGKLIMKHIKGTSKPVFIPQFYHYDAFYGLQVIKEIMIHVYLSLLMTGFTILMAYYYLPLRVSMVVLPFVAIYMFAIIAFVATPLYLLNRDLRHARDILLKDVYAKIGSLNASISHTLSSLNSLPSSITTLLPQLQLWQYHVDEYRVCIQIPTGLFSFKRWVIYIITYLIPVLGILL